MLELFLIFAVGLWLILLKDPQARSQTVANPLTDKINRYWDIVQKAFRNSQYARAERALLTILKIDEKNATAYNRLGLIYVRQKNLADAVECFEIAQSLEPSANNLHNVGLIYYNMKEFNKSVQAFEQALKIDDSLASRYVAYAKSLEKINKIDDSIKALEKAIEIEENPQILKILALAYNKQGKKDLAKELYVKATGLLNNQAKLPATTQPLAKKIIQ